MRERRQRDCSRGCSIPKINTEERVLEKDNLLTGLINKSFKKPLVNNDLTFSFSDITDFQHFDSLILQNAKYRLVFDVNKTHCLPDSMVSLANCNLFFILRRFHFKASVLGLMMILRRCIARSWSKRT